MRMTININLDFVENHKTDSEKNSDAEINLFHKNLTLEFQVNSSSLHSIADVNRNFLDSFAVLPGGEDSAEWQSSLFQYLLEFVVYSPFAS